MTGEDFGGREPDIEARFRSLHAEYGSEVISVMGPDDALLYESASIGKMLGYRHAEEVAAEGEWLRYVHPGDADGLWRAIQACLATPGESPPVEYRIKDSGGNWRWLESRGVNLSEEPGVRGTVVVSTYEVTGRKRAEQALTESEERFRAAFEEAPVGVALVGMDSRLLRVNRSLCEMFGYTGQDLLSMTSYELTHPDDHAASREWMARQGRADTPDETVELRFLRGDGRVMWASVGAALVGDAAGEPSHWVCHYQDITDRKALQERLAHQALHDPLTGLPNRALFTDRLHHALELADRGGGSVAVLFVDVDNFKVVNDSLGHEAGDRLLTVIGQRIGECLRVEDTISRIGGDEFAVLLGGSSSEETSRQVAERILQSFQEPLYVEDYEAPVGASVGIAVGHPGRQSAKDLVRHADAAMYRAKSAAKKSYAVYDPDVDGTGTGRLQLAGDLRHAIERGQLRVYYQHKVELSTGEIAGWEALLRWEHPEHGTIGPDKFIPLAEETGLIVPIGRWVLEEACRQAGLWRERYPRHPGQFMSVNLSARQLADPELSDSIRRALRQSGLPSQALDLEITERVLVEDEGTDFQRIRELKELGITLTLDDFGTGYSSMQSLKRLPADALKVDRSFVGGLPGARDDEAFVAAMVSLAGALGLTVVAEGIENREQWSRLRELGCDYGQGYHFAPPLPPEETSHYLETGFGAS